VYADLSGKNAVEAVKMAVEDFKAKYGENALGGKVEVSPRTTRTRLTSRSKKRRSSTSEATPTSSSTCRRRRRPLAIADVAKAQQKLYINVSAATTVLTGKSCNKYTFHYAYDTYMLAQGTGVT